MFNEIIGSCWGAQKGHRLIYHSMILCYAPHITVNLTNITTTELAVLKSYGQGYRHVRQINGASFPRNENYALS